MSAVYMLIRKLNFVGNTSVDTNFSIKVVTNHICTLSELCFIHNSCTFELFKVDYTKCDVYCHLLFGIMQRYICLLYISFTESVVRTFKNINFFTW